MYFLYAFSPETILQLACSDAWNSQRRSFHEAGAHTVPIFHYRKSVFSKGCNVDVDVDVVIVTSI
jgi:hypothetical protein